MYFYGNPGDYWILDTDFDSFSSVYSCSTVAGAARYELAFILTRDRFPANSTVRKNIMKWQLGLQNTSAKLVKCKANDLHLFAFQIEMAFDAFSKNNLILDWYPIPQFDSCVNDPPGNCKEDFPE